MTVDARLALTKLYDDVVADMAQRAPTVQQYFGWREKNRQILPSPATLPATGNTNTTGARIDWQPGNDDGALGTDLAPRNFGARKVYSNFVTGETPTEYAARNLADLDEICVVRLRAHDPLNPTNERAQYTLTRLLYNLWRGALYRAAHGNTHIDSVAWNVEKNEFRSGAQIVVTFRLRNPITDDQAVAVSDYQVALDAYMSAPIEN